MEPIRDTPWAEYEKVYLLAEILKASQLPSHVLYAIVRDYQVQPRWNEMALPPGRSLDSCRRAYDGIAATLATPDFSQQRAHIPAPIMYQGPEIPKKRAHQPETPPIGHGRLLQPRPAYPQPQDFMPGPPTYPIAPTITGEPAHKKKRGRPTKAEAQARADAAAARGETYPPPRKRTSVQSTDLSSAEARPVGLGTSPPGPPVPSGALTPQPTHTAPAEAGAESTSSKKKRSKPTPLDLERPQHEASETESPSAFGSAARADASRTYSSFTPISAPLPSATEPGGGMRRDDRDRDRDRDRDVRMEGVEEAQHQPRTTTPHSFKDTVGI